MQNLNLGCGHDIREGWLNYDMNPTDESVIMWRAGFGLCNANRETLSNESVEKIICSHMIEHIPHDVNQSIWFGFWEECWRVLAVGKTMEIVCPHGDSVWAWADPGHVRSIYPETFVFLSSNAYMNARKDKKNAMTPYEPHCNFSTEITLIQVDEKRIDGINRPNMNIHAVLTKREFPEGYLKEK